MLGNKGILVRLVGQNWNQLVYELGGWYQLGHDLHGYFEF